MILGDTQQLIQYSSASNMARVFVESIEKIEHGLASLRKIEFEAELLVDVEVATEGGERRHARIVP